MHTNLMFVPCSRLQIVPKIWLFLGPRSSHSRFICNVLSTHGKKPRTKHHLRGRGNYGSAADVSCLPDPLSLTCYHSLYSLFVFLGQTDKGSFWCEWTKRDNYYHSIIRLRPHHEEVCEHVYFTPLFNRIIRPACTSFGDFLCQTCRWSNWYDIISASEFISRLSAVFSRHPPTLPTIAAWYYTQTDANFAFRPLDIRRNFFSVFQLLVLKFGTVYHLCSRLRTWRLRPICVDWCDEISAPSAYWFLALYEYTLCMYFSCSSV